VRADTVLIGEIGLSGELRMVGQMVARLREAAKLGFSTAIVPRRIRRSGEPWPEDIKIIEVRSIREALTHALIQEGADGAGPEGRATGGQRTSVGQRTSAARPRVGARGDRAAAEAQEE
jgi:DNA repair protein RadA/Sms